MIKLLELVNDNKINSEDLENCDEYNLPDWWNNDSIELAPIKKEVDEIEFSDKAEFQSYARKHKMRPSTVIKISGKETTAGKLTKSGDERKKGANPYFTEKYGKLKLNAFPPLGVDVKDVKVNMEGNIHTHAVLQWKDPKSGRTVSSYTQKFMVKNAKIKWKRVQRIKPEYVDRIFNKSIQALRSRKPIEKEAGAIIAIISKTGLRPGSRLGYNDTGNRGVSTLGPENIEIQGDKIIINFVGKSYKPNNAEIQDSALAAYLSKKIKERSGEQFLFETTDSQLRNVFTNKLGRKGMKIKDLRTFTATKMADDILHNDKTPPLPLPENEKEIKKVVKKKLDIIFEKVSQKLNNTPAMAKSSYVHPEIINKWLDEINVKPTLIK